MMTLQERIDVLVQLGNHLKGQDDYLDAIIHRTEFNNGWFTKKNQHLAIDNITNYFLVTDHLTHWVNQYEMIDNDYPKKVGIVMAGNIPLVGFHDMLCTFITGHQSIIKLSDKDRFLLPYLVKLLTQFNHKAKPYFQFVDHLKNFEAVIATGSNNSARYFEAYFGKHPNIIRKNRNAIAVLDGKESKTQLQALANDIFQYFGLGCRNVSKIYVPLQYKFEPLLEVLHEFRHLVLHSKYKNNFDYHYALMLMNKIDFKANGCIIISENKAIASNIANLHYEYYEDINTIASELSNQQEAIQCIVSNVSLPDLETLPFGQAQQPSLFDYADGVDTVKWLLKLAKT